MGQFDTDRTKMKAFVVSTLLGLAAAAPAPDVAHHATISHGGVVTHAGHFAPHVGPAHVVAHAPVAHGVHAAPVVAHAVHAPVHHAVHPVAHAVHAAPVVAHAVHAAPVIAHAAPVVAHAVHAAPAETYADADDYSKSNSNAEEQSDGASNVAGSYSVALP